MRMCQVEYDDPGLSRERFVTAKSWEFGVCVEIKGMLESMGCTNCKIVPAHQRPSDDLRSRPKTSLPGFIVSEKENA